MGQPSSPTKIIHVDMDAFFAAVEQRDRPELKGLPVIVGGSPKSRGVVCTASYEARRFGVHAAMPAAKAWRLCPEAVFLPPDFSRYKKVSREVRAIFGRYTDLVEPLSLDEAFLDVTRNKPGIPSATQVAREILAAIKRETRLTASAGVGHNKFIAKVASDMNKPDGLCVVPPDKVAAFLRELPVERIPGIGPVTRKRLAERGIRTCGEMQRHSEEQLIAWFKNLGPWLFRLARGQDTRPVRPARSARSCGIEDTFPHDLEAPRDILRALARLSQGLEQRLLAGGVRGRTLTLKVKYADFQQVTRSRTLHDPLRAAGGILAQARELLADTAAGTRPVRLLGLQLSQLEDSRREHQLYLPFYEAWLLESGSEKSPMLAVNP